MFLPRCVRFSAGEGGPPKSQKQNLHSLQTTALHIRRKISKKGDGLCGPDASKLLKNCIAITTGEKAEFVKSSIGGLRWCRFARARTEWTLDCKYFDTKRKGPRRMANTHIKGNVPWSDKAVTVRDRRAPVRALKPAALSCKASGSTRSNNSRSSAVPSLSATRCLRSPSASKCKSNPWHARQSNQKSKLATPFDHRESCGTTGRSLSKEAITAFTTL